jgi:hypothetical protein
MRVRDDGGVAFDGDRHQQRPGAWAEHADEPLCDRGTAGQIGDGSKADELGMTVDVGIQHRHELGDVTTRTRGNESLYDGTMLHRLDIGRPGGWCVGADPAARTTR